MNPFLAALAAGPDVTDQGALPGETLEQALERRRRARLNFNPVKAAESAAQDAMLAAARGVAGTPTSAPPSTSQVAAPVVRPGSAAADAPQQPNNNRRSAAGTLTAGLQPGEANIRRGLELISGEDDYTAAQEYARERAAQGDSAMLNAIAASVAGGRFAPLQSAFLKRAIASQEPMKVGSATIAPDGTVIRDPSAERMRQGEKYLQLGQFEQTLDDRRQAREQQAADRAAAAAERAALRALRAGSQDDQQTFTRATRLRTELTQRLDKVASSSGFAQNVLAMLADPTIATDPTKQVALVTTFGKMLDPDSVVRESEYAMIEGARGAFQSVLMAPERLTSGARLTPQQLKSMGEVARNLYSNTQQRRSDMLNYYGGIAQRTGVAPEDVLPFNSGGPSNDPLGLFSGSK
jgi:hypothetical protein